MRIVLSCLAVSMLMLGVPRSSDADPLTIRFGRAAWVSADLVTGVAEIERDTGQSGADALFTTITLSSGALTATGDQSLSSVLSRDSRHLSARGRMSAIAESPLSGDPTYASAGGGTYLAWDFRLDRPYVFNFNADTVPSSDDVFGGLSATLGTNDNLVFEPIFSHDDSGRGGTAFRDHGRLEAGLYSFLFESVAAISASQGTKTGLMDLNVSLDLTPVPEPGTMSLLVGGLCAIAAGFRKRSLAA